MRDRYTNDSSEDLYEERKRDAKRKVLYALGSIAVILLIFWAGCETI